MVSLLVSKFLFFSFSVHYFLSLLSFFPNGISARSMKDLKDLLYTSILAIAIHSKPHMPTPDLRTMHV